MELQTQVEQQQHQAECRQHLEVVGVLDQDEARGVRAEQHPGEGEQGDGRQPDAVAEAGEEGRGEEGAAHGQQGVSVSHASPPFRAGGVGLVARHGSGWAVLLHGW